MIRKAKISDVGTIMTIINETVKEMKSYGIINGMRIILIVKRL